MRNLRMDSSRRRGLVERRNRGGGQAGEGGKRLLISDKIIHVITPFGELELGKSIFKYINYSPLRGRDTNSNLKMGTSDL